MLKITPIPAFTDNYIWAIHDDTSCIVVDPGEAAPVIRFLDDTDLTLSAILVTHHHFDHTGGIHTLLQQQALPVYGPYNETIADVTHRVKHGDTLTLLGTTFTVIEIPGHTLDHIAYFSATSNDAPLLFCGDTLFSGGCGRLFEGSPAQMQASLDKLAALPDNTRIYCAHEYTKANLSFARSVEPDNAALKARINEVTALRQQDLPTLPSSIIVEKRSNPFMRSREATVIDHARHHSESLPSSPADVLAVIRQLKDAF